MDEITVHWLLHQAHEVDDLTPLITAITAEGGVVHQLETINYYQEDFGSWSDDTCVVFYGTLRMASKILRTKPWVPGPIYDKRLMTCTHYYPLLGDHLTNARYVICPITELSRLWDTYTEFFGDQLLFVRPNSGDKSFTGAVFDHDEWIKQLPATLHYIEDDALVIVTAPKKIEAEYRVFVIDGKVVASSPYRLNQMHDENGETPQNVLDYAQKVVDGGFNIDTAFVLDIAHENTSQDGVDKLSVLEANSFSCSGMYQCDKTAIVKAAHDLARKIYNDYNNI